MTDSDKVPGEQSVSTEVIVERESLLVPYAPDFTPSTLGKVLGENRVLEWLLKTAKEVGSRPALQQSIGAQCLGHIKEGPNRRDMASHVVVGMRGYGLIQDGPDQTIKLTEVGDRLLVSPADHRDIAFARHIIASCNGLRLLDSIRRYTLAGQVPSLEDLAVELDRHATSKSISTMRAWLARAGIFSGGRYAIDEEAVARVLGSDVAAFYSLRPEELEFVLAGRIAERQTGQAVLSAPDVASIVDSRDTGIRIPRKNLSSFLKSLETKGLIELAALGVGGGGARTTFRLSARAEELSDEQLRRMLEQSQTGFPLSELESLPEVLRQLSTGNAERLGKLGEMLAVHLCLMLGLSVTDWRRQLPQAEIDLIAERAAALTYQRWAIQVKNTAGDLDSDRVDREVGAAAGTGVTHILFVVPRAGIGGPARRELLVRSRLTSIHIYFLSQAELVNKDPDGLVLELRKQERLLAQLKRAEAERRASDGGDRSAGPPRRA